MKRQIFTIAIVLFSVATLSAQRLVVRMDDIGASHAENIAVIKSYQEGIGRSAEIMTVCPWFLEGAEMLNQNPGLDVGIHVAFNSEWENYKWKPFTYCPSLCDEDGYLSLSRGGEINYEEVEAELRAQIEIGLKYCDNVTHISDHMFWTTQPGLKEMAIRVAGEYGLYLQASGTGGLDEEMGDLNAISFMSIRKDEDGKRLASFMEILKSLEKGKTYWLLEHPGLDNEEMNGIYQISGNGERNDVGADRQDVTDTFTSPEVLKYIEDNGIELVSFGDLINELEAKKN